MFSREVSVCRLSSSAKVDVVRHSRCRWVSYFFTRDATRLADTFEPRRKENVQFDKVDRTCPLRHRFVHLGIRLRRG